MIEAGREVGGGDARSDVGSMAHITEVADFGEGRYRLNCVIAERIRVLEWLPDHPYPRAASSCGRTNRATRSGPTPSASRGQMVALFERIAGARGAEINARDILAGADAAPMRQCGCTR